MTFKLKIQLVENSCALQLIKQMDLLEFMMEVDI